MNTNRSNSANVIFFLYTVGAIVPQDVTHLRVDPSVVAIPDGAFLRHRRLKEVILPEGLTAIGVQAFWSCTSLECINFPSTLTDISGGFYDCTSLREVDLSHVKTIGHGAFGVNAFNGCISLREVDLSNVITIGMYAFKNCTALERINFSSTLTAIGVWAFQGCTSLREVKLPEGIHKIGWAAFYGCNSLERINLPSTVTAIGAGAFEGCTSLREVKLVGGILDIGAIAFQGCSSLIRFQIPSKAFVIETDAYNCRLLTSGTITPTNDGQVMIASRCLKNMSLTGLAEVENAINAITSNREQTRDVILERIHALFAYYELVEAMTILELALWKAKLDEGDDLNTREECRFTCGAGIIIPIVLPFL